MKKTVLLFALAALPMSTFAARPASRQAAPAASASEIELTSQLPAAKREALAALVERFNAQSKAGKVVLADRDPASGKLPSLMILDEASEAALAGRTKPIPQLMKEAGEPLQVVKTVGGVISPALFDRSGKLLALPVALSTPVMFINEDLARRAGANVAKSPRTWSELQELAGKFAEAGVSCPVTVTHPATTLLENVSAWNNVPFANPKGGLSVNGLGQVRHVARMASWSKANYLKFYGRGDEAVEHFAKGECGVMLAGQSEFAAASKGGFKIAVSPLPYYEDQPGTPQNTLADGPALWAAAGKSAGENKLAARFVRFWLEPAQQVEWQKATGYLPLNKAGAFAAGSSLLGDDLRAVKVAVTELVSRPATAASRASAIGHNHWVRNILNEELEAVWRDGKAAKLALDMAVQRVLSCAQCRR